MKHRFSQVVSYGCILAAAPAAAAQVSFSVTGTSASIGTLDSSLGQPITAGDVLGVATGLPAPGPLAAPKIELDDVNDLKLFVGFEEVDALSYGADFRIPGANGLPDCRVWFSVDGLARSVIPMPSMSPTIASEVSVAGQEEVAADVWLDRGAIGPLPAGPVGLGGPARHIGLLDGDGLASAFGSLYPGLGLVEPTPAGMLVLGDDLDALDASFDATAAGVAGALFSLSAADAVVYGLHGGDILRVGAAAPVIFAPRNLLGLDNFGPNTDDLDALAVWDDGNGMYDPMLMLGNWGPGADMVLFSVTAGSAVIGQPDSLFGAPIQPGDILVPPLPGQVWPGIFIAAEHLGLRTMRVGFVAPDELDALDLVGKPLFDCDLDGVEDACQISGGQLPDANGNGLTDACDPGLPVFYCVPKPASTGCITTITTANPFVNPVSGLADYAAIAEDVKRFSNGFLFFGVGGQAAIPFAGGTLCVAPPLGRTPLMNSGGNAQPCSGNYSIIINDGGATNVNLDRGPGTQNWFQFWYRDNGNGPGVLGSALSDALEVTFE